MKANHHTATGGCTAIIGVDARVHQHLCFTNVHRSPCIIFHAIGR